ncbi:UV radiation resistance protein and autophagy-related subunit 14-domain-containing protein [Xylaria sp. FL1777]|nr:UV radiation resistance protein and autophagy-related subunit 14-domain-containing protein [Xylaria sp. FL1777]
MNCDICERAHHPKRLPFLCVVDARNELYEGRIANAKILMEAEAIESRVNKVLSDSDASSTSPAPNRPSRAYIESYASEEYTIRERTERIIASADRLRDEVAAAKKEIEDRRASIAERKSSLASKSQGVSARRNREIDQTRKAIKMRKYTWDREYEAMTQYKAALCMEVAKLYRLQRVRRGNPVRFEYKIGGIDIIDLQNMNNVQPELISASLSHITHLLFLTSHYLSIRLPAEITLPHNDYPRPTIFSLSSSYQHGEVAFPGSSPIPPDPRDRQFANVPFPRPLFIEKPLTALAKEDSATYNAFLEAVCLLAYDIVWLCRTQGVPVGDNNSHFDTFAGIGRNMYNLLINSSLQRNPQQIADNVGNQVVVNEGNEPTELGKAAPRMGLYSHGSGHTFLGSATGNDLTRNFKLPNPIKLMDKLKSKLNHENPIPEWEVLEDDAWALDDGDDGVLVGGARPNPKIGGRGARFGFESYMSVNTVKSGGNGDNLPAIVSPVPSGKDRDKGEKSTNGWTKIKPR